MIQMKNEVHLRKPALVEVMYHGDQTEHTMARLIDGILNTIADVPGRVDYLIDLSDIGSSTLAARRMAFSRLKDIRIRRQAIFGGDSFTRTVLNFMMRAVNKNKQFRYFQTRAQAERWLNS